VRKEREVLEHQTNAALMRWHIAQILPREENLPCFGLFQANDDAKQSRLTATAGTQERNDFAGVNRQRKIAQQRRAFECFCDVG